MGERNVERDAYHAMHARCRTNQRYIRRGVTVAPEFSGDGGFNAFLAEIGTRPSPEHSLDRVDNDRGYAPGNLRWATRAEQGSNTSGANMIAYQGRRQTVSDWARELGISRPTLSGRLHRGMSVESAFETPIQECYPTSGHTSHGQAGTKEYIIHAEVLQRCTNSGNPKYSNYGGRGIRVSETWTGQGGFERFLADVGPASEVTSHLIRIDASGNFEKENVRWASRGAQPDNKCWG